MYRRIIVFIQESQAKFELGAVDGVEGGKEGGWVRRIQGNV